MPQSKFKTINTHYTGKVIVLRF